MDVPAFVSKFLSYRTGAGVPRSFALHRTADGFTHAFFLGATQTSAAQDLFVASAPPPALQPAPVADEGLPWSPLVQLPDDFDPNAPMSVEEQLIRERMRNTSLGITSFTFDAVNLKLLIPAGGRLYVADVPRDALRGRLVLREVGAASHAAGPKIDAKLSADARLLFFVRANDLWALELDGPGCGGDEACERRLTFASAGAGDDRRMAGVADYIQQEEFDRYTGYWPAPAVDAGADGTRVYRVAYLQVDQSEVPVVAISNPQGGDAESFRYPKPGERNATATLHVAELALKPHSVATAAASTLSAPVSHAASSQSLASSVAASSLPSHGLAGAAARLLRTRRALGAASLAFDFEVEYVPRVGWAADAHCVWVQLLNRQQTQLALVLLDVAADFLDGDVLATDSEMTAGSGTRFGRVVLEEKSDIWVNITHVCHWLPPASASASAQKSLIWASERSGYRHLELVTLAPAASAAHSASALAARRPLTGGAWQVDANDVWIGDASETAYFVALADSHLRRQLYSVAFSAAALSAADAAAADGASLAASASALPAMQRLTDANRSHAVLVDARLGAFVDTASSAAAPPRTHLRSLPSTFSAAHVSSLSPPSSSSASASLAPIRISHAAFRQPPVDLIVPQFIDIPATPPASGGDASSSPSQPMQAMVYLPKLFTNKSAYPTVIYTYAGPHVQLVKDEYSVTESMRLQILANMGFVVAVCDGAGSWNRGLAYEGRIKHCMGGPEVADQVRLVDFLVARGVTDRARVAITGWSYGGYMSLMCLAQRPDVFKIAISGAPVTFWEAYDTGYTERYMDTPQRNSEGYERGSVLTHADGFPDVGDHRLVLVHGLIDENVHFTHTAALLDTLVQRGKPYTLKLFPSERHGLRSMTASKYFHQFMASHLMQHL